MQQVLEMNVTEAEMLEQFAEGYSFPPLEIRLAQRLPGRDRDADAVLEISSDAQRFDFVATFKARSTPRMFETALRQAREAARETNFRPMIVVPYLREEQLQELQNAQVSGIDLSGNGIVSVPGQLLVYRTGQPNQYPDSGPTKYAYRGATSLVGRVFLCQTQYESVAGIEEEIRRRGASVALSTVSKALKKMESDLIIDRSEKDIRLRQPEKLLEKLAESYREPKITKTVTCASEEPLEKLLANLASKNRVVLSGQSSVPAYAVMGRDESEVLYTENIDRLLKAWGARVEKTSRFATLELRQTTEPTVYFDVRTRQDLPYASPIQVFLELSTGDKRERETADQVKEFILQQLQP